MRMSETMGKKKNDRTKPGALRVWHIPQVPGKAFRVPVASVDEAKVLLRALAQYDLFQYENRVKPDYCNAQGLEVFEDGGWCEWHHPETDDDIGNMLRSEA